MSGAFIGDDLARLSVTGGVVLFRFLDSGEAACANFASNTFKASRSSNPIGEKSSNEDVESARDRLRDWGVLTISKVVDRMSK
jgi:hypothetical protein